ncbi:HAMP domain-containing sensor histidine kinase [Dictyobacter aurantiacus]|uniref:histidine kinase n=1 Tax=Dictyobacter aurantiacus TaxID=1936993 RepID=A0A401Z9C8_9CHLR|nr:sensor histidine kinase [Dictyobacter aurantiacus]GCE03406.1 hypothetical protein KDAU_07350 [Dictyobacter aurantiacus]
MPFSTRWAHRFHRLRWKLTFFYLLTTLLVLIALELLGGLLLLFGLTTSPMTGFAFQVGTVAQNIGANFLGPFANRAALSEALNEWRHDSGIEFQGFVVVIDPTGQVLAAAGDHPPTPGTHLSSHIPASVQRLLREAFTHDPSTVTNQTTSSWQSNGTIYLVAPVVSEHHIRGALLVEAHQVQVFSSTFWKSAPMLLPYISSSLLFFFVGTGAVGLAFGMVTARSLIRRIRRILASAEVWGQGDFSAFVEDTSADELGQLAQRLNRMAQEFHDLLHTRQELATLQERNRLARELHDSVKQHVFALSIWIRNTKTLIGHDEKAAQAQLAEAEQAIRQTQQELTALIRALRPMALTGHDLSQGLQEYGQSWQKQTGIRVAFEVNGKREIAPAIEEAFFRIAQEALANVARHSRAHLVTLQLDIGPEMRLTISDNGCGFDVRRVDRPGVGLASMRERMDALHGHIEIHSQPGRGTSITVRCAQPPEYEPNDMVTKESR